MSRRVTDWVKGTVAFGSVAAGYTALYDNSTAKLDIRYIDILNSTDVSVVISFDGTTDHFTIATTASKIITLPHILAHDGSIYVKRSAGAASSGSVVFVGAAG